MLQRNNGFFLPEMLLTLSAWLVIAAVFFPLVMNIVKQSVGLQQEFEGTRLLYEALLSAKIEGVHPVSETITVNQTVYNISLESAGVEVCIQYENVFNIEQKKCEVFE